MKHIRTFVALTALASSMSLAQAFTVSPNDPGGTGTNVVFNPCGITNNVNANTVRGCLQNDNAQLVEFISTDSIESNGGQARVEGAAGGLYGDLSIEIIGKTFDLMVLNINADADGWIQFSSGALSSAFFELDESGQNFFTITGTALTDLSFVTFTDQLGEFQKDIVLDTRQVRLDLSDPGVINAIPEPSTYALMLAGLGAVGFLARRRKV